MKINYKGVEKYFIIFLQKHKFVCAFYILVLFFAYLLLVGPVVEFYYSSLYGENTGVFFYYCIMFCMNLLLLPLLVLLFYAFDKKITNNMYLYCDDCRYFNDEGMTNCKKCGLIFKKNQ